MTKFLIISIILSFFALQTRSQPGDTIMNKLSGKWNWFSSEDGWGHHFTPDSVGYTRSIIFYQNKPDSGTDSLSYLTYRNDSLITSGRTYIANTYQNGGDLFANVILEDTSHYNSCHYFDFTFSRHSILTFSLCMTDYFHHQYKKDTLYNHVDEIINKSIYKIYPNPSKGIFVIDNLNKTTTIEIFNLTGEILYSNHHLHRQTSILIDLSNQQKGIYFAKIQDGKQVLTKKIIIK